GWAALPACSATSGVLGQAGSTGFFKDFPNAPFPNTWYSTSLANALSNSDLNGATQEINATFNLNVGTPTCLSSSPWYYGFDGNEGNGIDLVSVLLHEFGHGLGFQTFTNISTGAPDTGSFTIYDRFLRDDTTGKLWIDMTNSERVASAINTGNLVWAGPQVTADVPNVLGNPSLRINSPPGIAGTLTIGTADFGPPVSSPGITANVVQTSPSDGCTAVGGSVSGKIAFIDRGTCNFVVKTKNAQNAGAIGVIIGNVSSSLPPDVAPGMTGFDPTITIPTVSLALTDANNIRMQIQLGATINASMFLDHTTFSGADSANRAKMFAPNPLQSGSSVSHFDTSMFPNQLMEPNNSNDLNHSVMPPRDLTLSLLHDLGWTAAGSTPAASIQVVTPAPVSENVGSLQVHVTRTGDTSGISTVDYATSDTAGNSPCSAITGAASARCDYIQTLGTLTFAAGDTDKVIQIPIIDDAFTEGSETFTLTLSNVTGATLGTSTATLTINDGPAETGVNPIDSTGFFVRQHYIDFLNREPDSSGFNFWSNEINSCGANTQCIEVKRANVSAAFFVSIEFQETGYLVYRVYKSAFGNLASPLNAPVPIVLSDFLRDTQKVGQGVQVNVGNWQAQLEANKQAYTLAFVQRADFMALYPNSLPAAEFVNKLNMNAGGVLSAADQATLINNLIPNPSDVTMRSQTLRAVAENINLRNAEFNKAFVLMQYFGYLRRNPNDSPDIDFSGFSFWLAKLNQFNGDYIAAEMVKAFISSDEYRHRFGP
ncbi:MAG TPA: PA domain-containing protein, partial [Pyrinomonadaceae bacterium]|nr:PA domain-containing protein [Pyrinomonadaceae bacterium]